MFRDQDHRIHHSPYFPISNSTTSTSPFGTDGTSAPTFVNVTTTVNVTVIPTSTLLVPSNFTSFPNISTPDVTLTPIPTSSVDIPGNFTSFANITSTPEISILPIPTTSFANSTTAEEPTSSDGPTVTSIIILPTETTAVISSSVTTITSLVIDTTVTPIDVASSTLTSFSTSPTLVIVTTVTPIATASFTLSDLPTTVVTATNTVSSGDAPTGTPSPQDIHCGIRGTPLGTYYLATYAFNKANVAVTLQGCFQFCSIAVERCYSYEFYLEPGLQAPRCKLYGGVVAYEVTSIDPFQPYQWFDLACGDPTKFT
ncbi:hypothetical protein UCDDA912_g03189 [Diaporthe ampelina]|uniref:Apple domain-containing protein n=1 Tax=Diaporthe ampelina TaxID=1214573 RepID=A0A0G2IAV7_9PEZI|nr:hypothetical protein UCDDA912_g03189 [Diaporthe ampelina]